MEISLWSVNLCCWASTAAIAAAASFPNIDVFDLRSCSFASAASSFIAISGLPVPSLTFAWRLETSIAYLGLKEWYITILDKQSKNGNWLINIRKHKLLKYNNKNSKIVIYKIPELQPLVAFGRNVEQDV